MLWPSYKASIQAGTDFLFELGKTGAIQQQCKQSLVGKKLPDSLYVHRTAEGQLPPLLRLMILAARQIVGELEYDLIKIALDGKNCRSIVIPTSKIHRILSLPTAFAFPCQLLRTESKALATQTIRRYSIAKRHSSIPSTLGTRNLQNSPRKKKLSGCSGEQTLLRERAGRLPYKIKTFSSSGIL